MVCGLTHANMSNQLSLTIQITHVQGQVRRQVAIPAAILTPLIQHIPWLPHGVCVNHKWGNLNGWFHLKPLLPMLMIQVLCSTEGVLIVSGIADVRLGCLD